MDIAVGKEVIIHNAEAGVYDLPNAIDDFMYHSALLNLAEEGSETQARHRTLVDETLDYAVEKLPGLGWYPKGGIEDYIGKLLVNVEYPHIEILKAERKKKGLWK